LTSKVPPITTWDSDPTLKQYNQLLICIFTILIKGSGDIFQEINAVCKHGGYTNILYMSDDIVDWGNADDALRLFAANDRPSAARAIVLLLNGKKDQINNSALGGYISRAEDFIVVNQHRPEGKICSWNATSNISSTSKKKGGKNKSKKIIKKRIKKYTIKNKKQKTKQNKKYLNKKYSNKKKSNKKFTIKNKIQKKAKKSIKK
jgi:hypothetical protein